MKMPALPAFPRSEGMTTHDYAFERLRQAIMVGAFPPGTSFTIRGLAEALESSSTPVREALRRLTSIGALQLLENRRIVVPKMTPTRFEELISLRIVLESHAARRAVAYLSDRQIDVIVAIDDAIEVAILAGEKAEALIANQEFHRKIYMANPDQVAMPLIESVWLQLGPILGIAMDHVTQLYVIDRHREAIEALRQRDEDAVAEAIGADICEGIGGFDKQAIGKLLALAG
ncbi:MULTISPECIES: GntR family transcriptional regulator [unclassified Mesorhizobium]|uniref:GntR family transcriptional regulator n=1 Tax=unclassified Mesorhizobium TaxID=325217 RepID=UPI000FD2D238|nr:MULTISPECIES: GntR family transcriptional regulator [unclassified Mesorhizobium]RUU94457.1 GntR family transcriptional regulator [Mesorhizobium sp. M1A.F.Ca.IN.020.03.2.1]RWG87188.1 MAG: GntR family transcriptional regulator [Mesorhizobium sp.]RWK18315.1 MAG: GntR family transcriptional regulator [Mesorhizobium sp.]